MAKAGNDWERCFYGTIQRNVDINNQPFVYSKIKVNDGYIYSRSDNQNDLGTKLDELVVLVLDKKIHKPSGVTSKICDTNYYHN